MNEEQIEALIEQWFKKHFHGLGLKLDMELYNLIHAAKDDLKAILGITPESASAAADSPAAGASSDDAAAHRAEEA